jgi:hypothetical protein
MTNLNLSKRDEKVRSILAKCIMLNGTSFIGIRGYKNSQGEISNHVIIANFSYANAVKKDLAKLKNATEEDIENIAKGGHSPELVREAIQKLIDSFEKNSNPETGSNQSKGQKEAFTKITDCIKMHNESGELYIYAISHSKQVIVPIEYKPVNSKPLTLAQNAVKKYFDLTTAKYRSFVINEDKIESVRITGDTITLSGDTTK